MPGTSTSRGWRRRTDRFSRVGGAPPQMQSSERRRRAPGPGLGPNGDVASIFQKFPASRATDTAEIPGGPSAAIDATGWPHGFAAAERTAQRALSVLRTWLLDEQRPAPAPPIMQARALVSRAASEIRLMGTEYTEGSPNDASADDASALYDRTYAGQLGSVMKAGAGELERIEPRGEEGRIWLERLWHVEVLSQALPSSLARTMPPFGFVRMSAECDNALGLCHRKTPSEKLSGLQIGHFGGFLKRSWRVNDWIWGRLDGAWYLVHLLLDEVRLWDALAANPSLPGDLAEIAFPDVPDLLPTLIGLWDPALPADGLKEVRKQFVKAFDKSSIEQLNGPKPPPPAGSGAPRQSPHAPSSRSSPQRCRRSGRRSGTTARTAGASTCRRPCRARIPYRRESPATSSPRGMARSRPWRTSARPLRSHAWPLRRPSCSRRSWRRPTASPVSCARRSYGCAASHSAGTCSCGRGSRAQRPGSSSPPCSPPLRWSPCISSALAAVPVPAAIGTVVVASALLLESGKRWQQELCTGIGVGAALVACAIAYHHHSAGSVDASTGVLLGVAAVLGLVIGWLVAWKRPKARLPSSSSAWRRWASRSSTSTAGEARPARTGSSACSCWRRRCRSPLGSPRCPAHSPTPTAPGSHSPRTTADLTAPERGVVQFFTAS